jgi:hypothetical protein
MRLNVKNNFNINDQMNCAEPTNTKLYSKEDILLSSLLKFYRSSPHHLSTLSAISKQKTIISLREMDYTVTNYSFNNKIVYELKSGGTFNMSLDYKNQLRGYSKKCLDPFCRRQRIFLDFNEMTPVFLENVDIVNYKQREDGIVTTIGQLNFFRWAISNEVVEFCFKYKKLIDKEMETMEKEKKKKKKNNKQEDSEVKKHCNIQDDDIKVLIKFE